MSADNELERLLLKFKWQVLIGKSPEFIVRMIRKKIEGAGYRLVKAVDPNKVRVSCVTTWDKSNPVKHGTVYVYQQYEGYEGDILSERVSNGSEICRVRIRKDAKSRMFETEILKVDLEIINDGKEKEG